MKRVVYRGCAYLLILFLCAGCAKAVREPEEPEKIETGKSGIGQGWTDRDGEEKEENHL